MVGSAIYRRLSSEKVDLVVATRQELDLMDSSAVSRFFSMQRIDEVYLAAAKVGGIHANNEFPADFIFDNLTIQNNVLQSAFAAKVKRLLFLGSSCIYPKFAEQPIKESSLLKGPLEATNEPYAIAKIAGIKLCESYNRQYGCDFRAIMPTNLYGEGDNFHPQNSHVLPALIRRIHEAKQSNEDEVTIWGSGTPKREFLHVEDMADASIHLMNVAKPVLDAHTSPMSMHVNAGAGSDISIAELARLICQIVEYNGSLNFDTSKPDGTPRKLLDVSKMRDLGWQSKISLKEGIERTYIWYLKNKDHLRAI